MRMHTTQETDIIRNTIIMHLDQEATQIITTTEIDKDTLEEM